MALIARNFLDSVVAIGTANVEADEVDWTATGFFYGLDVSAEDEKSGYSVYLVSNRHVFDGKTDIYLKFNHHSDATTRGLAYEIPEDGVGKWFGHPDPSIDIAVIPVDFNKVRQEFNRVGTFTGEITTRNELRAKGVMEGDGIFVLGFPLGLVSEEYNAVILRTGVIARIRDTIDGHSNEFLIDSFVFPGNSGGPVLLKPEFAAIDGTNAQRYSMLIGIVRSYVPYEDVAYSLQTMKPRAIFQENSGLALVHPIHLIHETVKAHDEAFFESVRNKET